MKSINLSEVLQQSICSFEMAKKAWENGINLVNTIMWFDDKGVAKIMGKIDYTVFQKQVYNGDNDFGTYPCISLPHAISVLGKTTLDPDKILVYCIDKIDDDTEAPPQQLYYFNYDGKVIAKNENLVDLLLEVWINNKKQ